MHVNNPSNMAKDEKVQSPLGFTYLQLEPTGLLRYHQGVFIDTPFPWASADATTCKLTTTGISFNSQPPVNPVPNCFGLSVTDDGEVELYNQSGTLLKQFPLPSGVNIQLLRSIQMIVAPVAQRLEDLESKVSLLLQKREHGEHHTHEHEYRVPMQSGIPPAGDTGHIKTA
jgi:hypothetical protein